MIDVRSYSLEFSSQWEELVLGSYTATWFQRHPWILLWYKHFGGNLHMLGVYDGDTLIGIAPFIKTDASYQFAGLASVLGGEMVSDFGDIISLRGREKEVWQAVLDATKNLPFDFKFIREESPSVRILQELGYNSSLSDISPVLDLPRSWDEYLLGLDRKDRHELKRKIRRLEEESAFKVCHEGDPADREEFFRLMSLSNDQKRDFLSKNMRNFFDDLIQTFWKEKTLSICFMKLNGVNIAAAIVFNFRGQTLLYNSGFDPVYSRFAPGFLLKAYLIKQAIEEKKTQFDFLRGSERYKFDLGGRERKLYTITL